MRKINLREQFCINFERKWLFRLKSGVYGTDAGATSHFPIKWFRSIEQSWKPFFFQHPRQSRFAQFTRQIAEIETTNGNGQSKSIIKSTSLRKNILSRFRGLAWIMNLQRCPITRFGSAMKNKRPELIKRSRFPNRRAFRWTHIFNYFEPFFLFHTTFSQSHINLFSLNFKKKTVNNHHLYTKKFNTFFLFRFLLLFYFMMFREDQISRDVGS